MESLLKLTFILPMILMVRNGESVSCELSRHEYYIEQADICKKCDPCPEGYGKVPLKDIDFEISPEHGATDCLRCVQCEPGKTFSTSISHRQCRSCKNCTALNKSVKSSCTATMNTKCQKIRAIRQSAEQIVVTPAIHNNTKRKESRDIDTRGLNKVLVPALGSISGVLIVIAIVVGSVYCIKSKCRNKRDTDYKAVSGGGSSSSDSSPYSSTDIETDGPPGRHVKRKQCTEQEKSADPDISAPCAENDFTNISKLLGVKSEFANLGRKLGVPDVDLQIIIEQNKDNLQEQAYQTLLKWKQLNGNSATKITLYNTLLSIDRRDIAQILNSSDT